jgi:hypothetical protein
MKTQEENVVDRKKFKSVAVPVDTYKILTGSCRDGTQEYSYADHAYSPEGG